MVSGGGRRRPPLVGGPGEPMRGRGVGGWRREVLGGELGGWGGVCGEGEDIGN